MTTENQPTDPTDPVPPTTSAPGTVEPDNWHTEDASEVPIAGLLTDPATTAKPGQVKPNNWHTESEPAS
ncbi:hypothetical protein RVR_3871 [Actinacidiphila reveromycinica]|uniref:Uncharacterized protein n=1 Tax=Actinacidiphila reveromycinica TaxID=659352 RepID=A0A7U3USE5_9ACTN|nr:hypothetical protein [Streptomyces sp. SN-593]BBA97900.1 hypothetical protein RVR_3871 [Streptomyces sp. SN-593]